MKWLRFLVVLTLIPLVLVGPVWADSSEDVTVTAAGWIAGMPGNFTLTYVTDYEIGISWEKGEDAVNTMVRAAYGRIPENIGDGYQVYYGSGTSCTDTAVTLASPEIVIYRAWSQNENGVWSDLFASGDTGEFMSVSFLFIGLIALAGLLTFIAMRVRMLLFSMAAATCWLALGIFLLVGGSTNLDIGDPWVQVLGFVFIMMPIAVFTLQMRTDIKHERMVRGRKGGPGSEVESWTEHQTKPKGPKKNSQLDYKNKLRSLRK